MATMAPVIDITGEQLALGDEARKKRSAAEEMDADRFFRIVEELRDQPAWRTEADKACDYYDGNQLKTELLAELERIGLPPIVNNLIQPTIDIVLGLEAKMRTDWRVTADSEEWADVAEAQSQKLFEAERETRADRACSDGYASQVKGGIGWTEVTRNSNPFAYPYRVSNVHRREIWWDWAKREPDLSDCMYIVRRRWYEQSALEQFFPDKKELIHAACNGWPADLEISSRRDTNLGRELEAAQRWPVEDYEWYDLQHRRTCIYEVNYRVFSRGFVLKLPDGRTVEMDKKNPIHLVAVGSGRIKPVMGVYSKLRRALWLGPHKLADKPCRSDKFRYVPWWGYTEDMTGSPYGLIRSMISPQDEVNARAQKMLWMMATKRVTMDSDALDAKVNSVSDMINELSRPDAVIQLNPERKNRDRSAFDVNDNIELSAQQFQAMQSQVQMLQQVRGIFNAMLGRDDGARSGIAINSLVEQGMTVMAEINDNARYARRQVGELLMELINDDISGQQVQVMAGEGKRARAIVLNEPAQSPDGLPVLKNSVRHSSTKVALTDVPSTPAYRAQQLSMLSEIIKSMPEPAQAVLAPVVMEMTDIPDRREYAELMRKVMGTPPVQGDPSKMSDQERAEMEEANAKAAEVEALAKEKAMLENEMLRAEIEKTRAEAMRVVAPEPMPPGVEGQDAALQAQIAELQAQIAEARDETERREAELMTKLQTAQINADATVERERERGASAERIAAMESRLSQMQAQAGQPQRIIMERPKEDEVKKEEVMEIMTAATKAQGEMVATIMKELGATLAKAQAEGVKALAAAQAKSGEAMASAVARVEEAVAKPRTIELKTDARGKPMGATSRIENSE